MVWRPCLAGHQQNMRIDVSRFTTDHVVYPPSPQNRHIYRYISRYAGTLRRRTDTPLHLRLGQMYRYKPRDTAIPRGAPTSPSMRGRRDGHEERLLAPITEDTPALAPCPSSRPKAHTPALKRRFGACRHAINGSTATAHPHFPPLSPPSISLPSEAPVLWPRYVSF